jgi:uncharacterized protein YkwD
MKGFLYAAALAAALTAAPAYGQCAGGQCYSGGYGGGYGGGVMSIHARSGCGGYAYHERYRTKRHGCCLFGKHRRQTAYCGGGYGGYESPGYAYAPPVATPYYAQAPAPQGYAAPQSPVAPPKTTPQAPAKPMPAPPGKDGYTAPAAPQPGVAPAPAEPAPPPIRPANPGLGLLNQLRAAHGLSAVIADPQAGYWAARNSAIMANRGMGHHVTAGYRQVVAIAADASTAMRAWANSPSHRAIILDPAARYAGLAWQGSAWTVNLRR